MKNFVLSAAMAVLLSGSAIAQTGQNAPRPIFYSVSFPNAVHHEAEVIISVPQAPSGPLRFRMSRSSPGRYATHEFGKNVYNVKAVGADDKPLTVNHVEGDVYEVPAHGVALKLSYTLFGNWTDGTYASIDLSHVHLNMPAAFMWLEGAETRPVMFAFNDLDKYGWRVITQLKHENNNIYSAPNMQYMMDSPVELSASKTTSWEVANADGKKQKISIAVHSNDDQSAVDGFGNMVKKLVEEERAVFGEFPIFDYGEYTFINDIYPTNSGDGMEHRNSTLIVDGIDKLAGNEIDVLGTYSHEFFHAWNVERIRPKSLEPFDFKHANMSSELWFAEGFTQYYGELILKRAGFHTLDRYRGTIAYLINSVLTVPGAAKYPATEMSRKAVFVDAGVSVDPVNYANNFLTYYNYGAAIALALDLHLRGDFNTTLDDYMRAVWQAHGKEMKPYTMKDLQNVLAKLTNTKFAADFFTKYVNGIEKNDYAALLQKAGFVVRKAAAGKPWIGMSTQAIRNRSGLAGTVGDKGFAVATSTIIGSPVYKAGIDAGDMIVKADGKDVVDGASFSAIINTKKPGDQIPIVFTNRTGTHQTTLTIEESPAIEVVSADNAGGTLTAEQTRFRNNWLSSKIK